MKYKIGQKVRVVNHPLGLCGKHCFEFTKGMLHLKGKEFKIRDSNGYEPYAYLLDEVDSYVFSPCMLESTNNRGKNPRGPDGRYMPIESVDMKEVDRMVWGFKLPKSLTINGVKYVQDEA